MRTYITLERVQQRLKILDSRIGDGDGNRGAGCFAGSLVEELHADAPQVVRDGLDLLLQPRLFGDLKLLALGRGRDERRHVAASFCSFPLRMRSSAIADFYQWLDKF